MSYEPVSAPIVFGRDIPRNGPQSGRSNAPRPLRLLAIGDAAFTDGISLALRGWTYARIVTYLPANMPASLANSFDLALADCTRRDSTLVAAIDRLQAASLPWIGMVPELKGNARAWLLDCGAADYVVGAGDAARVRLAAAVADFAANRKATVLVVANESEIRERLSVALTGLGFGTVNRRSGDSGKDAAWLSRGTQLAVFGPDLGLPKTLEWLERLQGPDAGKMPAIVLAPAPFGGDVAAILIKHGAFDVLPPPYAPELLALRVNLAMRVPNLETALREAAGRDAQVAAS